MQYVFLYNQSRCIGCQTCVVACRDWHGINTPGLFLRRHSEIVTTSPFQIYNMLHSCNHCDKPRCVIACGLGAIKKDKNTGRVYLDQTMCHGLVSCQTASGCPYGNITRPGKNSPIVKDPSWRINTPSFKCDMCPGRLEEGKLPICVSACINRALDFGTMEQLRKKYPQATQEGVMGFEDKGTHPNRLFIKK